MAQAAAKEEHAVTLCNSDQKLSKDNAGNMYLLIFWQHAAVHVLPLHHMWKNVLKK